MEEYDEFGNRINGSGSDSDSGLESGQHSDVVNDEFQQNLSDVASDDEESNQQLVQHDGSNGLTLSLRFGPDVDTVIINPQDTGVNEPVIRPSKKRKGTIEVQESDIPKVLYSRDFMVNTANQLPERIRNVAVVGNFHTGKTSFIDLLVLQTHEDKEFHGFTDTHTLEVDRGMSIKSTPITLLLNSTRSYVFNLIDAPGHTNFMDESIVALEASDGALLVIDAVEGPTFQDILLLEEMKKRGLPFTLLINKVDRLILDLRLPVKDAYFKLQYLIDQVGVSPENTIFASSTLKFCFTLASFSQLYLELKGVAIPPSRLWGNNFYDSHRITKRGTDEYTFIHFILEPLYKVITYAITGNSQLLSILLENFGVSLLSKDLKRDSHTLLPDIFTRIFPIASTFVDCITSSIPPPAASSVEFHAKVVKLVPSSDGDSFLSLVRIHSGTIKVGDEVKVVTETGTKIETISRIYLAGGRYKVPINEIGEGFIALVGGVEASVSKQAFLVHPDDSRPFEFHDFSREAVFKVAVEPKLPQDAPKLLDSLKKVTKTYLSVVVKTEPSGENVILSTGEIAMDCILHDVRNYFQDRLEIRVSDPMVKFSEACSQQSVTTIVSRVGGASISIIAEPSEDETSVLVNSPGDKGVSIGFKWAAQEGPLVEEPIRYTKFKILDIDLADANDAQIVPLTRRACYTGFLTAVPKLLEPIYAIHISCTFRVAGVIAKLLAKRRGVVFSSEPIVGSPLYYLSGRIPVIESFGVETDIRLQSQGQAMCYLKFMEYDFVPGNPLDADLSLPDLKPVPEPSTARDFMLKTRRRKGVTGAPTLQKYIDGELYDKLKGIGLV